MSAPNEFLDRLIGQWELTGQMGSTPLHQAVVAHWVLAGRFVELRFTSMLPAPVGQPPYDALYFVGYDEREDLYVLHLLDTFGPEYSRWIGLGKREGEAIAFVFQYADGPFTNRFQWDPATQTWIFDLTYEQGGQVHTFATKRMRREA